MIKYYNKRIDELNKKAQELDLEAEREMREGSGARAMEYCKQADEAKAEAKKWRDALEDIETKAI